MKYILRLPLYDEIHFTEKDICFLGRNKNGDDVYGVMTGKGLVPISVKEPEYKITRHHLKPFERHCQCECHEKNQLPGQMVFVDHFGDKCCVPDNTIVSDKEYILKQMLQ